MQTLAENWNVKDVFVPQAPNKWEWDVGHVLLQGDFPLQCSTLLDSTRNSCIRPEIYQKTYKPEAALNEVNE